MDTLGKMFNMTKKLFLAKKEIKRKEFAKKVIGALSMYSNETRILTEKHNLEQ